MSLMDEIKSVIDEFQSAETRPKIPIVIVSHEAYEALLQGASAGFKPGIVAFGTPVIPAPWAPKNRAVVIDANDWPHDTDFAHPDFGRTLASFHPGIATEDAQ